MTPTWKKYTVLFPDGKEVDVNCYTWTIEGSLVKFWMPEGSFIIRDGIIDPGGWKMVASFSLENISGYVLKGEKSIT